MLLLLLLILSFCLGLSVSAPHTRWLLLALFLCWLVVVRGPPFCLLVSLHILLGSVLLGFCGYGYSLVADHVWVSTLTSLWISCRWSGRPLCVLPMCLAGCSWLSGSWCVSSLLASVWRSRFRVPFSFSSAHLSLSLCASMIQPSHLWGLFLLALVSVFSAIDTRVVPRYLSCGMPVCIPQIPEGLSSGIRSIPPSWWGPALLFSLGALPARSSSSVWGIGWSSWLSPLPAAWLRFVVFSRFPVVWFGASATFLAGPTPGLSLRPLGCSTVSSLGSRQYVLS